MAIGLHAALLGVLLSLKLREKPLPTPPPEIWLDVDAPTQAAASPGGDGTHLLAVATTHPTTGTWRPRERTTTATVIEPVPEATTTSSAEPPPTPMILDPSAIGLGGFGSYRSDMARQAAPTPDDPAANENATIAENLHHAIMDPIHERERLNGTLADGPIAMALEGSTRSSNAAPFEGRAVFSVRIDELGLVVGAQVVEASSDWHGWEEVATRTFNALAQKRVHLPRGAKGMVMRVEVTSKVVYPSGAEHPMTAQLGGPVDPSSPSLPLVSGSFDLSDIGSHPMRVVGSRVLSETAF